MLLTDHLQFLRILFYHKTIQTHLIQVQILILSWKSLEGLRLWFQMC